MNLLHRIESFLNGNIIENKKVLAKVPHRSLRDNYARLTGCDGVRANAFADYIKGEITFQEYCDSNHQPPSRTP
tara:strand:+ start:1787 stop:2008 length:222 start_codon:yes stop_codon:yes gene_type:complete